jgi:hypothetical protein
MSVTIETVNSELHTVVWNNRPKDWIDGGMPQCQVRRWPTEHGYTLYDADYRRIGTALRAVPRKPDIKRDERLWYAYASMGVYIKGSLYQAADTLEYEGEIIESEDKLHEDCCVLSDPVDEISHGTFNGKRCEVAIYDND